MVVPESWDVKTPDTPVRLAARTTLPVTVAPDKEVVKIPVTAVIVSN
jgi:hypothetical protein